MLLRKSKGKFVGRSPGKKKRNSERAPAVTIQDTLNTHCSCSGNTIIYCHGEVIRIPNIVFVLPKYSEYVRANTFFLFKVFTPEYGHIRAFCVILSYAEFVANTVFRRHRRRRVRAESARGRTRSGRRENIYARGPGYITQICF